MPGTKSGEVDERILAISMPDMPSIMQWCNFEISAKRPPSRPSTIQVSHNGRERSRGCEAMRPASVFSCSSLPGRGNAVWRMW